MFVQKEYYTVDDLRAIMILLRSPGGCPWDREQTHASIRRNMIEEAYEAAEAIDEGSAEHLREELGDVLLQVVFHAQMESEAGGFDLDAVADGVCKKLILRHPHIFGDVTVSGSEEVLKNWDEIKKAEKHQATTTDSMNAVAKNLPALWRAEKIQKKAAKTGFDWPDAQGALDKLDEEAAELRAATNGDGDVFEELGDLLFACVNAARHLKIDPEDALHAACDKFTARFCAIERAAAAKGRALESMTLAEQDELWDQIKKH